MQQSGPCTDDGLVLVVQNTFLEIKNVTIALPRSRSESDVRLRSDSDMSSSCDSDIFTGAGWLLEDLPSSASLAKLYRGCEIYPSGFQLAPSLGPEIAGSTPHPSLGSDEHDLGSCHPCCFFQRDKCTNGHGCNHCHYKHERVSRKGKNSRIRAKVRLEKQERRQ